MKRMTYGVAALAVFALALGAQGATYTKKDEATATLNQTGAWATGIVPTSADIADWSGAYNTSGGLDMALGNDLSWKGITIGSISGTAAGTITIANTSGKTLTLGTSGIDMSGANQNLTINNSVTFGGTSNVNIATGRTLILAQSGSTLTFGAGTTTTLTGVGTFQLGGSGATTIAGSGNVTINSGAIYQNAIQAGSGSSGYTGTTTLQSGGYLYSGTSLDSLGGSSAKLVINGGTIGSYIGSGSRLIAGSAATTINGNFTIINTGGSTSALTFGSYGSLMNLGNGSRTITVSATSTFLGNISDGAGAGAGALIKTGASQLTLSRTNSYTGLTRITNGTLSVAKLANGGSNSSIGASSNAAANLVFGASGLTTGYLAYTGSGDSTDRLFTINGHGLIENNGTGALNFTNTGSMNNSGATQNFKLGGTYTGGVNTFAPVIVNGSGTTNFEKYGNAIWLLTGSSSYSGTAAVTAGILKLGNANALGNTTGGTSVTSGAVLDLNGQTVTNTEALTLNGTGISSGGALINSSATAASYAGLLTLGSASSIVAGSGDITLSNTGTITGAFGLTVGGAKNTTIASIIGTGAGTLTKQNAGTLTLSGASTYTGATSVSAGLLSLTGTLQSAITVSSGAALSGTGSTTGDITFNAGSAIVASSAGSVQGANVSATATTSIFVTDTPDGTLKTIDVVRYTGTAPSTGNFSAASNYRSGALTDTGSKITLDLQAEARMWGGATGTWEIGTSTPWATGGNNDQMFYWGDSATFGNLSAANTVTLSGTLAPSSITVSNTSGSYAYTLSGSGVIAGAGALAITGGGDVTFNSTTANTYTGGTTISAGRARVSSNSPFGTGPVTVSGSGTTGGQVYTTAACTLANDFFISGYGGGAVDTNQRGALRLDGGTISGTVTLTGAAGIDVNSGTGTILGNLAGSSALTVNYNSSDTGTLVLKGNNNNFSGSIMVNKGTLQVFAANALGSASGVTIANGVLLRYSNGVGSAFTSTGHTITLNDGAMVSNFGGNSGAIITVVDNFVLNSATTAAKIGGFLYGDVAVYSGTISGTGSLQITALDGGSNGGIFKDGWRTNSYNGNTSISGLGTLTFSLSSVPNNNDHYTPFGVVSGSTSGTVTITNQAVTFSPGSTANEYYIDNNFKLVASGTGSTTLRSQDAVMHIAGTVDINQSGTGLVNIRSVYADKDLYLDGVVSGSGTASISSGSSSSAKVILTNSGNSFSGTYLLDASGTSGNILQLNADGAAQYAKMNLSVAAAKLAINTSNATIAGLNGVASANIYAVGTNRTLTVNTSTADSYAGTIGASGTSLALVKSGSGTLTLSGAGTYTGGTTVSQGILQVGHATATNKKVTLNGGSLTISDTVIYNIDSGLTFASNTGATVSAASGTAKLSFWDVNSTDITVNTGITASIDSTVSASISGAYGLVISTAGTGALTMAGKITDNTTIGLTTGYFGASSVNGDKFSTYKLGTGTLTLTGASDYTVDSGAKTAAMAVTQGTLKLSGGNDRLPTASSVYLGNSSNNNATLVLDGINQTLAGLQSIGTGTTAVVGSSATLSTLTVNNANNYTFGGKIGGVGTNENNLALAKSGAGTLTLSGANTYTGGTTVSAGVLQVGSTGATNGKVTLNGGSLTVTSGVIYNIDGGLTFASASNATAAAATGSATLRGLDVNDADVVVNNGVTASIASSLGIDTNTYGFRADTTGDLAIAGVISGTGQATNAVGMTGNWVGTDTGALYKLGTGTLTLSGASTFNAGTTAVAATSVQNGTLKLTIGNDRLPTASAVYLGLGSNSGKLVLDGINQTITGLQSVGTGTGNAVVGASATLSTLTVNNTNNYTFGGTIGGAGTNEDNIALTKTGAGKLTLSGANSYTGATSINNGILEVTVNNALGTTAAGTTVANGAALKLTGVSYITAEALSINGTGISGGGALVNSGTSSYAGQVTAATSATINVGGGSLTFTGGLVKDGTVLTLTGGGHVYVNTTGISGSSTGSDLVVDGTIVDLDVVSSYNGPTFIRNGGTINANIAGALPTTTRSDLTMDDIGTGSSLILGANQVAASLTGASTSTVNLGNKQLTVGTTSGSSTFAGIVSGTGGSLVKDGASKLTLSNANSYSGDTTVSAGTLALTGSGSIAGSPTINVAANATLDVSGVSGGWTLDASQTLKGSGTVVGNTTAAGHVAPGNSIGTLNITGDMTISGTLDVEYDGDALTIDLLAVTGNLNISFATVDFAPLNSLLTGTPYIFATYGTLTGDAFSTVTDLPDGYMIDYAYNNGLTSNNIALTVIPEPGTAGIVATFLAAALLRKRRFG